MYVCMYHRHLKLSTESSHAWVHSIFNVISANVVYFLPKYIHIIIQVYGHFPILHLRFSDDHHI